MRRRKPDIGSLEQGIKLLARREHSERELRIKLSQRGFDRTEIEETIDVLKRKGYLSDARFCEAYIQARRNRGFGPLRIKLELESKGVADEQIRQSLELDDDFWRSLARAQCLKRFGAQPAEDQDERARRVRFLLQKGFISDQIKAAMEPQDED